MSKVRSKQQTLLLKHTTGKKEQPRVQKQQRHPQINHLAFMGTVLLKILFIRPIVALNSSGAIFEISSDGNSELNLFDNPKIFTFPLPLIVINSVGL